MSEKETLVMVGATSAIAEQCSRLWLAQGSTRLVLIGRDLQRLQRVADDLKVRSPDSQVTLFTADFLDPNSIQQVVSKVADIGPLGRVMIAHGSLSDQFLCQQDLLQCQAELALNGVSPVLFAEGFAHLLEQQGSGHLVIIGSVAGDRGRKSNYVYGSSKAMIECYAQGLQHRFFQYKYFY